MADILNGVSGHASHAPLSYAQTMAVTQHLADLNAEAQKQIKDLRSSQHKSDAAVSQLQRDLARVLSGVDSLREECRQMRVESESTATELRENVTQTTKLKASATKAHEGLEQLREWGRQTSATLKKVEEEVQSQGGEMKAMQNDLNNLAIVKVGGLEARLETTVSNLQQSVADHEVTKVKTRDHNNQLQDLNGSVKGCKEEVRHLSTSLGQTSKSLADATMRLEKTRANLDGSNGTVAKLQEAMFAARSDLKNLQSNSGSIENKLQKLDADHAKTAQNLEATREDASKASAVVEQTRQMLRGALDQVRTLADAQSRSDDCLKAIGRDFDKLSVMAKSTKDSLSATNSLVLPNLTSEEPVPLGFNSTISTVTRVSTADPMRGTPRRKREVSAWVKGSLANTPDRMANI